MLAANFAVVENNFIVYSLRLDYNFGIFREHRSESFASVIEMCNENGIELHKTCLNRAIFKNCAVNEQVLFRKKLNLCSP